MAFHWKITILHVSRSLHLGLYCAEHFGLSVKSPSQVEKLFRKSESKDGDKLLTVYCTLMQTEQLYWSVVLPSTENHSPTNQLLVLTDLML